MTPATVRAIGVFSATGRQSGVPVKAPMFEVVSFQDGLVLSARDYLSRQEAEKALR